MLLIKQLKCWLKSLGTSSIVLSNTLYHNCVNVVSIINHFDVVLGVYYKTSTPSSITRVHEFVQKNSTEDSNSFTFFGMWKITSQKSK